MLHGTYKGDLFEALNEISKLSNDIENSDEIVDIETVPYGVDVCDDCGCPECECGVEEEASDIPAPKGAAGNQDENAIAVLGSEKSEKIGNISTEQLVEESLVTQIQSIIKSNMERAKGGDFDPLNFFKEPVKVDMYEPKIEYGDEML